MDRHPARRAEHDLRSEVGLMAIDAASGRAPSAGPASVLEIVCMATRPLESPLPTNVQHLMGRLAARHRVLYVEPAVDPLFLARHPARRVRRPARPDGPDVLTPLVLPWAHRVRGLEALNRTLLVMQVRRRMRARGFGRPVLWLFSPLEAWVVGRLGERCLCYHITDDYGAAPWLAGPSVRPRVLAGEARLLGRADCVFITSAHLAAKRGLAGDRVHVVPNVADVEHFAAAPSASAPSPPDLAAIPRPIVGFVGAVDGYKVDLDLLRASALATPDLSYVLIGPVGTRDPATRADHLVLPNVHLLGPRAWRDLPRYVRAFDVAVIPYRLTSYTESCSPLKLYEYLAAGKPVVATDLPGVREAGDLVTIAHGAGQFAAAIRRLAAGPDGGAERRAAFAERHSWARRVTDIEAIVRAAVRERAS
jgi:glycosyltransferase involved in cell wall biosynthesis